MCGQYVLINGRIFFAVSAQLQTMRNKGIEFDILPKYNARPAERMPVIAQRQGSYGIELMRWNLVPHWSKEGASKHNTFNARAEQLAENKLFAPYFRSARCLVPADGFYEWKKFGVDTEINGKRKTIEQKQKMFICMKDRSPFMMAGLFSVWKNEAGEEIPTYTIITTEPNTLIAEVHHRMPVILHPADYETWLNRDINNTDLLQKLLVPYPEDQMEVFPVSNKNQNVPEAIEKIDFEMPGAQALMKISEPIVLKKP